jgi:hypothetical protein
VVVIRGSDDDDAIYSPPFQLSARANVYINSTLPPFLLLSIQGLISFCAKTNSIPTHKQRFTCVFLISSYSSLSLEGVSGEKKE